MAAADVKWVAPGKGAWELDATHIPRPVARFTADAMENGMPPGFAEGTARFGLMLDHLQPRFVNGLMYHRAMIFGAPEGAVAPPPKLVLQLLTRLHPAMRKRLKNAETSFATKQWRADLARWDNEIKPAAVQAQKALQSVDPTALDDAALAEHVELCAREMTRMVKQHHQFTITACMPIGDLLAHVTQWTGLSSGEVLAVMRGSSPISVGVAAAELDALGAALREDEATRKAFEAQTEAADAVELLRKADGAVGKAMAAYLDVVGYRSIGYDVADLYALEMPGVLVRAIRVATAQPAAERVAAGQAAARERTEKLRARVPEAHREEFDQLLAEARNCNRLRDERGQFSDAWATGLARRALLAAGARLAKNGRLSDAMLALEGSAAEVAGLLRGNANAVSEDELRTRRERRTSITVLDAPPWLGAEPAPPPPVEWLPAHARRAAFATAAAIVNLFGEPPAKGTARSVEGLAVSPGVYEGRARLVRDQDDFARIEQGDVLVTRSTSPYFNVVLPLLGGIVTDRGGQLSHAAIVAREYGIPGVVGTREATQKITDGCRVRVDGDRGVVEVLA